MSIKYEAAKDRPSHSLTTLIARTIRDHPIEMAAHRLIELVKYPSGALPDDVTVILASLCEVTGMKSVS